MKKTSKKIPISAAKEIGKKFDKDQVILVTWNKEFGDTWVTTWGKSVADCGQAAEGGNLVKQALGWPNELTQDKATRQRTQEAIMRKNLVAEILAKLDKVDKSRIFSLNHYEARDVHKILDEILINVVKV